MSILDRKLVRDLWLLRGQVLSIALVIGAGVAVLVMSVSSFLSLRGAQQEFYRTSAFAEIFAEVKRAPQMLFYRISEIAGVAVAEGRISGEIRVEWPGAEVPVTGRILSLPLASTSPRLNRLTLSAGRLPEPNRPEETLIHAAFAEARQVRPNDEIFLVLNGRRQSFLITGIVHSPEFIFTSRTGSPLPDDRGFVILWGNREAVERAFDMEGAVNEVLLTLSPAASAPSVIAELDRLLLPWGGRGAYDRRDQPSHRFLEDEFAEQRILAVAVPLIFFAIAAFLLHVVVGRMVEAQREQVAALRALGYPSLSITLHYVKFLAVICIIGAVCGIAIGAWMGAGLLQNYRAFFRFPTIPYVLPVWLPLLAASGSFAIASLGVFGALRRLLLVPAAEGLRPPTPRSFAGLALGTSWRWPSARSRIPLRSLAGRPVRSGMMALGIALALPMVVLGLFWWDALDEMIALQFDRIERADAFIALTDARPSRAVREIAWLPGVMAAEGQRIIPVRLRAAQRSHLLALTGLSADAALRVPRDIDQRAVAVSGDGLALSRRLAAKLHVQPGDLVHIEVLERTRQVHELPVTQLIEDIIGFTALMDIKVLNRLMREDDLVSHIALRVDPLAAPALWQMLAERPRIVSTQVKGVWLRVFQEVIAKVVVTSAVTLTAFGMIIAFGIVYNSARVTLQERGWEMASLCVLGFTRLEVARILLTELVMVVLVAVPLGLVLAQWLVVMILQARDNESFDVPAIISTGTLTTAALVVLGAALISAFIIIRRIGQLDLIIALKTRE